MMKARFKYTYGEKNDADDDVGSVIENDDLTSFTPMQDNYKDSTSGITKLTSKSAARSITTAFKKPVQKKKEYQSNLGNFIRSNQLSFNQISQIDDNKVRIIDSKYLGRQIQKSEVSATVANNRFKKPETKVENASAQEEFMKTLRAYRKGELPDIMIRYQDILEPLTVLCFSDPLVAQEILVPIFIQQYN
jgi:ATP-dependent Clp protease ATP-binding subunit ClpA